MRHAATISIWIQHGCLCSHYIYLDTTRMFMQPLYLFGYNTDVYAATISIWIQHGCFFTQIVYVIMNTGKILLTKMTHIYSRSITQI